MLSTLLKCRFFKLEKSGFAAALISSGGEKLKRKKDEEKLHFQLKLPKFSKSEATLQAKSGSTFVSLLQYNCF